MNFLSKIIAYGLYLLVFLLPLGTRWIIKAGQLNNGPWEYGTYSLYLTDIVLIFVLALFVVREIASFRCRLARNDKVNPPSPLCQGGEILDCSSVLTSAQKKKTGCLRPPRLRYGETGGNDKRGNGNDKNEQIFFNSRVIWWLVGGLIIISAISVFFAADRLLALYKFGWLILGVGLFWLVASANYDRIKLIYAMLAGAFFQAGLGIWQFLSQSSFASKWLGLAIHNGADLGASVIEAVGADGVGERWLRAYGGMDHPNILGGVLAVATLLIIFLLVAENSAGEDKIPLTPFIKGEQKQIPLTPFVKGGKILLYFLLIVFTAGLFFSFSRSAWLALAAGLAVLAVLAVAGGNLKSQKGLAEIILVMGILLLVLFSQYGNLVSARLGGQGRLEAKSNLERLASDQEAWQIIKSHWLLGVGLGNYTLAVRDRLKPLEQSYYYQPAHNVFLLVWSEIGIFGLLFFLGLLFAMARSLRGDDKTNPPSPLYQGGGRGRNGSGAAVLVALIVIMSLDHWLFSLHFGALFFWLVMGLVMTPLTKGSPRQLAGRGIFAPFKRGFVVSLAERD